MISTEHPHLICEQERELLDGLLPRRLRHGYLFSAKPLVAAPTVCITARTGNQDEVAATAVLRLPAYLQS
jgi:hypothetical protein